MYLKEENTITAILREVSTSNAFNTQLSSSLSAGATSMTLDSVTGLVAPGVLCIDRQDGSGNNTPSKREYVIFTAIAGNVLTITRGAAGSTDQLHSAGAIVEENLSVTHWGDLLDFLQVEHDAAGRHVISTATITTAVIGTRLNASAASNTFGDILVSRNLFASGASIVGVGINPVWMIPRTTSAATAGIGTPIPMPHTGAFEFFTMTLARGQAVSGASLVIDINKNGVSIFEAGTRPFILSGGTFVSTASINTKLFTAGDVIDVDLDTTTHIFPLGGSGSLDISIVGHAAVQGR